VLRATSKAAAHLPLGILLMRAFCRVLTTDLEDAARLDGCTDFGVYRQIMLPLFAGIVISFIPTLLLYVIFQRQFVRGITVGAVRG
jgi:ABC-type glycerol-3-phosphate transport system permease component